MMMMMMMSVSGNSSNRVGQLHMNKIGGGMNLFLIVRYQSIGKLCSIEEEEKKLFFSKSLTLENDV